MIVIGIIIVAYSFDVNLTDALRLASKDSDKSNNRIDNLEYVTPRDNMAHRSVKNGWMVGTTKKYNGKFQANITKDKQQEAYNAYVKKTKKYGEELKYV